MFFENYYIVFSPKLNINLTSSYQVIMTGFINKYVNLYNNINSPELPPEFLQNKDMNKVCDDAIIYSKYYLYYKTMNCTYSREIMEVLLNIDYNRPIDYNS